MMTTDHATLVRALAETLDTASTDGLPAASAMLAAHAARHLANVAEGVEELSEAAAIMHSVAEVLGAGTDVSASLCFLLARNVRSVPALIGAPAARVVALRRR